MNYNQETVNVQFMNQQFLSKVEQGMTKEAGVAMSAFVRQKLREDGFARKILPAQPITAAELDRDLTEEPRVICEKEPDSVAATLPFHARAEIRYWNQPRYSVTFEKISSKDFRKNKFELMTSRTDIRTLLQENSVKDLQEQEDLGFYNGVVSMASTYSNTYTMSGGFTPANFMGGVKKLLQKRLPVGCILMTQSLHADLSTFPSTVVGSPAASGLFMGEATIENPYGFKVITTVKNDILPDNRMIVFAPPQYMGQFYELQGPTVFLKAEQDTIEFVTNEFIGIGIGNVNSAIVIDF